MRPTFSLLTRTRSRFPARAGGCPCCYEVRRAPGKIKPGTRPRWDFQILSARPAISQQALAAAVGTVPSRLVALIDELESQGLVERRPHETDRRSYALHLTEKGKSALESISRIAREHRQDLLAALSEEEQRELTALLQRVAEQQGLIQGVHPGFAKIGETDQEQVDKTK